MKFYLHHHQSKRGSQIYFEFYSAKINGRFIYPTGHYVHNSKWNIKGNTLRSGANLPVVEQSLNEIWRVTENYLKRSNLSKIELKTLLNEIAIPSSPVKEKTKTLLEWWELHLTHKPLVKPGALKAYSRVKEIFESFLRGNGKQTIQPKHYTDSLHSQFEHHLAKRYSPNQCSKIIKRLKEVLSFVEKKSGKIENIDVEEIKYKENSGRKISLNYDQIQQLIDLDLMDRLDRMRDIMVVHCLTGVRVSDLFRINDSIIKEDNTMTLVQQKTKKTVRMHVQPTVRRILKKHGGSLPTYSQKEYRLGIKDVYKLIDSTSTIEVMEDRKIVVKPVYKEISSHDMVRTFITIAYEKFRISVGTIARIVGKSEKVINKHYLNPSDESALNEFREKMNM